MIPTEYTVQKANRKVYKLFADYHYIKTPLCFIRSIWSYSCPLIPGQALPPHLGVLVYSPPIPSLKARNQTFPDLFPDNVSRTEKLTLLNEQFTYLSRLIVDPHFQRHGIADRLLKETLPQIKTPYIETLTPIDFTNDMFIKHGFQLHLQPDPQYYSQFRLELQKAAITGPLLILPNEAQKRVDRLDPNQRLIFDVCLHRFLWHFKNMRYVQDPLQRLTYALSKFPYPNAYLVRRNG